MLTGIPVRTHSSTRLKLCCESSPDPFALGLRHGRVRRLGTRRLLAVISAQKPESENTPPTPDVLCDWGNQAFWAHVVEKTAIPGCLAFTASQVQGQLLSVPGPMPDWDSAGFTVVACAFPVLVFDAVLLLLWHMTDPPSTSDMYTHVQTQATKAESGAEADADDSWPQTDELECHAWSSSDESSVAHTVTRHEPSPPSLHINDLRYVLELYQHCTLQAIMESRKEMPVIQQWSAQLASCVGAEVFWRAYIVTGLVSLTRSFQLDHCTWLPSIRGLPFLNSIDPDVVGVIISVGMVAALVDNTIRRDEHIYTSSHASGVLYKYIYSGALNQESPFTEHTTRNEVSENSLGLSTWSSSSVFFLQRWALFIVGIMVPYIRDGSSDAVDRSDRSCVASAGGSTWRSRAAGEGVMEQGLNVLQKELQLKIERTCTAVSLVRGLQSTRTGLAWTTSSLAYLTTGNLVGSILAALLMGAVQINIARMTDRKKDDPT